MRRCFALFSALMLSFALLTACSSSPDHPEPRGNWADGMHKVIGNPDEDCDTEDLRAGDLDCTDADYQEAFGHLGFHSRDEYKAKYPFVQSKKYKEKKKKDKLRKDNSRHVRPSFRSTPPAARPTPVITGPPAQNTNPPVPTPMQTQEKNSMPSAKPTVRKNPVETRRPVSPNPRKTRRP